MRRTPLAYRYSAAALYGALALSGAVVFLASMRANAPQARVAAAAAAPDVTSAALQHRAHTYLEVTGSCGPAFSGACVNARSGPGEEYPVIEKLRTGIVLRTDGAEEHDGHLWHRIIFDEWVRYPDRLPMPLYVAGDYVRTFSDDSAGELPLDAHATSSKHIVIDRSEQMLYAYDGDTLFMQQSVSTGLDLTPTPRGTFRVYKKTPTRYMQGPLPGISDQYYDLPGVPWNLYFTQEGGAIHGAYWHDRFGEQWSHGCVNLSLAAARQLYEWTDLGTTVVVQD